MLRVLQEARLHGAITLNYAPAENLLRGESPKVLCGAQIRDAETGTSYPVRAGQ